MQTGSLMSESARPKESDKCEENLICWHYVADMANENKARIDVGGPHNEVNAASRHISLIHRAELRIPYLDSD